MDIADQAARFFLRWGKRQPHFDHGHSRGGRSSPGWEYTHVAVGRYSPTDFSFWSKTRTLFSSIAFWGITVYNTGAAFLLAFSFAGWGTQSSGQGLEPTISRLPSSTVWSSEDGDTAVNCGHLWGLVPAVLARAMARQGADAGTGFWVRRSRTQCDNHKRDSACKN